MQYDEFRAMNSDIVLAASGGDPKVIERGFLMARQLIYQNEKRFTRFTDTSELAELNRSAGTWYKASVEMFQVIQEAHRLAFETEGLFNPAVLPALKQAGYNRSMDEVRNRQPRNEPSLRREHDDYRAIKIDPATHSVLMPLGMQIDLGGIAKGWIAEQAAQQLVEVTEACAVSAGGDMVLINLPKGEPDWEVGLENPLESEKDLAILHVMPGAIATSSTGKRQWRHNGKLQHHIIDPRSGEPAHTEWLSTTVWAKTATEAEVYAKVLLITGPQKADELFRNHTEKAYLAVDKTGWVHGSKNYHEVFNLRLP
jgi:FAD:protein FMN transferase